ncbi:MAG: cell division protein FtsL [Halofilum sp. (in: g-proteobacteria)]|nr:cell division protein FtsL [Halofilum sp. (in: g-proteobacteria)]
MTGTSWTVALLAAGVFASALGVVYSQHRARALFIEMQQLEATQAELDTEWGRLELEQSTWATHGRIERLAREKLDMRLPDFEQAEIVVLQ